MDDGLAVEATGENKILMANSTRKNNEYYQPETTGNKRQGQENRMQHRWHRNIEALIIGQSADTSSFFFENAQDAKETKRKLRCMLAKLWSEFTIHTLI